MPSTAVGRRAERGAVGGHAAVMARRREPVARRCPTGPGRSRRGRRAGQSAGRTAGGPDSPAHRRPGRAPSGDLGDCSPPGDRADTRNAAGGRVVRTMGTPRHFRHRAVIGARRLPPTLNPGRRARSPRPLGRDRSVDLAPSPILPSRRRPGAMFPPPLPHAAGIGRSQPDHRSPPRPPPRRRRRPPTRRRPSRRPLLGWRVDGARRAAGTATARPASCTAGRVDRGAGCPAGQGTAGGRRGPVCLAVGAGVGVGVCLECVGPMGVLLLCLLLACAALTLRGVEPIA